jgi:hypothetical protein
MTLLSETGMIFKKRDLIKQNESGILLVKFLSTADKLGFKDNSRVPKLSLLTLSDSPITLDFLPKATQLPTS